MNDARMSTRKATFGFILILVGFLLLLDTFHILSFAEMSGTIIPLILIGLGIWLIIRKRRHEEQLREHFGPAPPPPGDRGPDYRSDTTNGGARVEINVPKREVHVQTNIGPNGEAGDAHAGGTHRDGKLQYSKLLGDLSIDLKDQVVENVEVSTFIGDVEIRLHGAKLSTGLNRMILSGFIGDVRVLVPRELELFAHCSNFIGDIELLGKRTSGFGNNLDGQTADYTTAERRLYIASNNFIGDIRVYVV